MSVAIIGTSDEVMGAIEALLRRHSVDAISIANENGLSEIMNDLHNVEIICAPGNVQIGPFIFDSAPRLRALVTPFTGIDGFDIDAATSRGIVVVNGPTDECVDSMAEATVMLALVAAYDLPLAQRAMDQASWGHRPTGSRSRMLRAMTIGVVGYGRIGQAVVRLLETFGPQVNIYAPRLHAVIPPYASRIGLNALVQSSDMLILAASLTTDSRHMISAELIGEMKQDVAIINVARGSLIDEEALVEATKHRRIGRIMLDVFEREPLPLDSPLRRIDGAILTPHCVGHSREATDSLPLRAVETIRRLLRGEMPQSLINPGALAASTAPCLRIAI